ncbi:MAG: hypothetical protein MK078_04100 [Crocinitomicaceae bacterium]|nr:hypothetical protein [Crocinitomicaceae bacterium]
MIRFLLYSNFWISLGAALFTLLFYRIYAIPPDVKTIAMVGCLTFVAYNFQRIVKAKLAEKSEEINGIERLEWIIRNIKVISVLTLIASFAGLYFFGLNFKIILELSIVGIFSFFYVVKIPLINIRLREIPGAKIILISLSYAVCCSLIPASGVNIELNMLIISFGIAFFFILAITIPFDIRDIHFDSEKIRTIPQVFGVNGGKAIAMFSLCVSYTGLIYLIEYPIAILTSFVLATILILYSKPERKFNYYAVGVDGLLVVLPLFVELERFLSNLA